MAKIYFRYGAMDSSKTANLLMVAYNYEKQGRKVLVFKPSVDNRFGVGKIVSRLGIERDCIDINDESDLMEIVMKSQESEKIDCILLDECQFINETQVLQLVDICDNLDIPIICYGLKNSYISGRIFPGIIALLYYADSIEEVKNVCAFCDRKATMNLRVINGKAVYSGNIVEIGDTKCDAEEHYYPACRKHYMTFNKMK